MMTQFVQDVDRINYTAMTNIKAGDIVEAGARHGVAITDIKTGEVGAIKVTGVFKVAAAKATTFAVGDTVNFNAGKAVKTEGNALGIAVAEKTNGQDFVTVMLVQSAGK